MSDLSSEKKANQLTPVQLAAIQSAQAQQAVAQGAPLSPVQGSALAGQAGPTLADVAAAGGNPAPALNPREAGTLGLSSSDVAVTTPGLETTGHAKPGSTDTPAVASPAKSVPMATKSVGPAVAKAAPSVKDIVTKIISGESGPTGKGEQTVEGEGDFWKNAAGKLGDFLQRWGMGLQGAPTGATQGDIQRQQAFELQKQQAQAQILVKQQALENQYQTQRMQLQQQMNQANMTAQGKIDLQNRITALDEEYKQRIAMFGPEYEARLRALGLTNEAIPANQILSQGK